MQDSIDYKGQSTELLKRLHILTRDGKINLDSRRKLKQVNHLVQFIEPMIQKAYEVNSDPLIVDCGAGKSYLGFILYDLLLRTHTAGRLLALEVRDELYKKGVELARAEKFDRMFWRQGPILEALKNEPLLQNKPDLVCALHACDTATDEAIRIGVDSGARFFALVPCCQAEVARQLEGVREVQLAIEDRPLHELWDSALHRREFGSHLTNVLRCLYLQSKGYRVTVTEFTGFEHTQKNELIMAEKISEGYAKAAQNYKIMSDRFRVKLGILDSRL